MKMNVKNVFIIDDDASVRDALLTLVESVGLHPECFESADEFLKIALECQHGCVVTDICLPGTNGIQLQKILEKKGIGLPIIAMSAHGDIPMAVEMVRLGAIDFIEKPFRNQMMLQRIHEALEKNQQQYLLRKEHAVINARLQALTPREHEILALLLQGDSNKLIAREMALSPRTVEVHRANILKKLQVKSVTEISLLLKDFSAAKPT